MRLDKSPKEDKDEANQVCLFFICVLGILWIVCTYALTVPPTPTTYFIHKEAVPTCVR
jgi:hypothetical protein